jgi:la-related protein 1
MNDRMHLNARSPEPKDSLTLSPDESSRLEHSKAPKPQDAPNVYWVKDKDSPAKELPPDVTSELYLDLRDKALEQRQNALPGLCPYDMDVLYQFWSHFLIRNFNTDMYNEFRQLAFEDAENGSQTGKSNLLKYYGNALSSQDPIRGRIARHYVQLAKSEEGQDERPATTQLRTTWKDGVINKQNRKIIREYMDQAFEAALG